MVQKQYQSNLLKISGNNVNGLFFFTVRITPFRILKVINLLLILFKKLLKFKFLNPKFFNNKISNISIR